MQDRVDLARHVDELRHVRADEPELRQLHQVPDVVGRAGEEVVEAEHLVALGEESLAQVGAEEPGAPGDDRPAPLRHLGLRIVD